MPKENRAVSVDWISLIVVIELGIIGTILAAGLVYLSYVGQTADAALFTLAGGAVGALGSMLANTGRGSTGQRATDTAPTGATDDPVNVATPPAEPLQVQETPTPPATVTAADDLADIPTIAVDDDEEKAVPSQ